MRIAMLGPLEVVVGDERGVFVAGARLRTLLIILALAPGRLVPTAQLVDGIWDDEPPTGAVNALQALVSRLRRVLPDSQIESHPAGYRLVVDPDVVDVTRFEQLVAAGRAELARDPASASRTLRDALALWRGPALLDVADRPYFQASLTRLEQLRLTAIENRIEADLRLGRGAELVSELTALVADHPLQERLVGALMRSLSEAGQPAEALVVYERAREALADQLGSDPSPELSATHLAILRGEVAPAAASATAGRQSRTNLRAGLTSFVGRDGDVAELRDLVGEYRLVSLIGSGGSGKTRLAVEASRTLLDRMPDGVWLVELAPVADGADLPSAVLAAMGIPDRVLVAPDSSDDPIGRLAAALGPRSALLVLDNCEHVIGAVATLAERLLGECPRLRMLTTSREPLGITGEAVWPVAPLSLPPADADVSGAEATSYDAVRLLADRARAVRPGFTVTDDDVPATVHVCRALDGLPLAIELAAARLRTLTVAQLAERLDDRFRLLTGGSRTAMPRHQTLRAVVDWSWELLTEPEQVVLRRLAVFASGATVEAAERVCADDALAADVPELLTALADKSLLVVSETEVSRYSMLETIKAYCLERLDEAGERDDFRRAHAAYVVELAETAEPFLRRAEQLVWLRRLDAEHDDINAALRGAIAAGDAQTAARLVAAAGWYWWLGGHRAEGLELAVEALGAPGETDDEVRAMACVMVAYFITGGLGDVRRAEPWIREAQTLSASLDHPGPLLRYAALLGTLALGEPDAATALEGLLADDDPWVRAHVRLSRTRMLPAAERRADIDKAIADLRAIGERWGLSYALLALADLVARRGDLREALDYSKEAIVLATEVGAVEDLVLMRATQAPMFWLAGDTAGSSAALAQAEQEAEHIGWPDAAAVLAFAKAEIARWSGDAATARAELSKAEAAMRNITIDPVFQAMILDSFAHLDAADGDLEKAGVRRAQAVGILLGSADPWLAGQVLVGVADQAVRQGAPGDAARLLAASEAVCGGPDLSRPDGARVEAAVREALGEPNFSEAMRHARKEFGGVEPSEPAAAIEAVRELAASVLGT